MEVSIPSLLRIKPRALNKIGKYMRAGGYSRVALVWGEGLAERFGERVRISLDATDVKVVFEETASDNDVETLFRTSLRLPFRTDALLAVGGGKAIDCAKYIAHLQQKPLVVVPTAISNDGFCSPFSSLLANGARRTMKTVLPDGVVLDTAILGACPPALLYSGVGDLFCKYTAVADWKLAFKKRGDPVNDFAAVMAINAADTFLHFDPKSFEDLDYMRVLASSLMMSGIAMQIAGSSRPASGAEHLVSHAYDQVASPPALHGLQVGAASYLMAHLQESTREAVVRCAESSGFLEYLAQHPLNKAAFVEALKRAPLVKEDFYTVLSEPGAVERALELCESDAWMQRILAA
jgi:glycerol-1-phosphate dehydrogenase [NAD(P)+]